MFFEKCLQVKNCILGRGGYNIKIILINRKIRNKIFMSFEQQNVL